MEFFFFFSAKSAENLLFEEIAVLGVSTKKDPFVKYKVPGLSEEKTNSSEIICNLFECRSIVQFCGKQDNSRMFSANKTTEFLSKNEIENLEKLAEQDAFVTFLVDSDEIRVPLFKDQTKRIFTKFEIFISPIKFHRMVKIRPDDDRELTEGEKHVFTIDAIHFNREISRKKGKEDVNIYLIFSLILFSLSVFAFTGLRKRLALGDRLPYKELWAVNPSFKKKMYFINTGLVLLFNIIILLIEEAEGGIPDDCFMQNIIIAQALPSLIYGIWGSLTGIVVYGADFYFPPLVIHALIILPVNIVSECCRIWGNSWRGIGTLKSIFWNCVYAFFEVIGAINVGFAGTVLNIKKRVEFTEQDASVAKGKKTFMVYFYDFLYSVLIPVFTFPALKSVSETFINGTPLIYTDILAGFVSLVAVSGVFSMLSLTKTMKIKGMTWDDGYITRAIFTGIITFVFVLLFNIEKVEGIVSKSIVVLWSYVAGIACTFLSAFAAFVFSFLLMFFSFGQIKAN